jgi:cyclohexanecarboxylate-CoA ligase
VDLLRVPGFEASRLPHLSLITVAGAPIPRNLIPAATNQLDAFICPAWGMTEYGIGISGRPSLDPDQLFTADGVPVHGCEVRITVDGDTVGPGRIGALEIRGSGLFLGYYGEDVATSEAFTEDGWFRTGDLAQINSDGLVALQGRSKDIIIRGGENIPVAEIETVLSSHPAIVEAVVVGAPDARLGERACAIVVVEDSAIVRLEEIVGFCLDQGLSKHHLPERLEIVQVLPKTASGKVRKHELRRQLAAGQEL